MRKYLIILIVSLTFITGCAIKKVETDSIKNIFDTILYREKKLSNTYMDGYKFYLPKGVTIVDKKEYNLKLKDNKAYYYLYVDTIAYYYKTNNTFTTNTNNLYSEKLRNGDFEGYIDIEEVEDRYFIVLMYNYAKIEAYVPKEDLNSALTNMSYVLSTIKFNDKVIDDYIGSKGTVSQEEDFNIFDSKKESDSFLTYEKEYGTYKEPIVIDDNVVDIEETND
jgi:hypothetical protein